MSFIEGGICKHTIFCQNFREMDWFSNKLPNFNWFHEKNISSKILVFHKPRYTMHTVEFTKFLCHFKIISIFQKVVIQKFRKIHSVRCLWKNSVAVKSTDLNIDFTKYWEYLKVPFFTILWNKIPIFPQWIRNIVLVLKQQKLGATLSADVNETLTPSCFCLSLF